MRRLTIGILALFALAPASAATFTVTNTDDSGAGSLRQAIADANSTASDDIIEFSVTGIITLTSGELVIANNGALAINGPGASALNVTADGNSRVLHVLVGADAVVNEITISDGYVSPGVVLFYFGAGIRNAGTLTLNNSIVSDNFAGFGSVGAGIYNIGTMTISESTVRNNLTIESGGGIVNAGTLIVDRTTVADNIAIDRGGGILNGGILWSTNSTISGNQIFDSPGGGIYNSGTLTAENSTVSNNYSASGGGIYNSSGLFSGTVTVANSIVAGNIVLGEMQLDVEGSFISLGYNLIGDASGSIGFPAMGDRVGNSGSPIDPLLGPLQDNGGPTETHALLEFSPAIDAGNSALIPAGTITDQRGFQRIVNGTVDIGAVEFGAGVLVEIDIKPGSYPNSINLKSTGKIPVAILTTDTFYAPDVNFETVEFGPNCATESHGRAHVKDVDGDGDMDMVLHFKTRKTGIQCGDTEATLTGMTFSGEPFSGTDSIRIVKCR